MTELPESEQPQSRLRVLEALRAAGDAGLLSTELCERAGTNAAVRRVWELVSFYGYRIIGEKLQRNNWRWTYVCDEPWAIDPTCSVKVARSASRNATDTPQDHTPQPSLPLFEK